MDVAASTTAVDAHFIDKNVVENVYGDHLYDTKLWWGRTKAIHLWRYRFCLCFYLEELDGTKIKGKKH